MKPRLDAPRLISDVFVDALDIYRSHFLLMAGLALVFLVPLDLAIELGLPQLEASAPDPILRKYGDLILAGAIVSGYVLVSLITCAYVTALMRLAETGRTSFPATVGRAALLLPKGLVVVLAANLGVFVSLGLLLVTGSGVLFSLSMAVGIYISVAWYFAVHAVAAERASVVGALRRSAKLVNGRWVSTLGALFLIALAAYVVTAAMELPARLALLATGSELVAVAAELVLEAVGYSFLALTSSLLFFSWRTTFVPGEETPVSAPSGS